MKLPAGSQQRDGYNCGLYMCHQIKYVVGRIANKNKEDIMLPKKQMFPIQAYNIQEIDMLYMRKCIILLVKRLSMLFFDTKEKIDTDMNCKGEMTQKRTGSVKYFSVIWCINLFLQSFISSGEFSFFVSKLGHADWYNHKGKFNMHIQ